jgi:very-short-patch-repair endonuclease
MNTNQFIEKAIKVHGNKYNYDKVNYINNKTKVIILCSKHGSFEQTPLTHIYFKSGCPECSKYKKLTSITFIERCRSTHYGKYDYTYVDYKNMHTKIIIICPTHGEFSQTPLNHLKYGCKRCTYDLKKKNWENVSSNFNRLHENLYDYSIVQYQGMHKKIKILCKTHGQFEQTPANHLQGKGCPKCAPNSVKDYGDIFDKLNRLHDTKYSYGENFPKTSEKIEIVCSKHGVFYQTLNNHLDGHGCPFCNESLSEKKINNFFKGLNIKIERQKKFQDCIDKKQLPFDFYLPDYNVCIEFDGEHHYKEVWGGLKELMIIQKHDNIKNQYCKDNGIKLHRLNKDDNIFEILLAIVNEIIQYN